MKEMRLLAQNRNYAKTLLASLNWQFHQGWEVAAVTKSGGAQDHPYSLPGPREGSGQSFTDFSLETRLLRSPGPKSQGRVPH